MTCCNFHNESNATMSLALYTYCMYVKLKVLSGKKYIINSIYRCAHSSIERSRLVYMPNWNAVHRMSAINYRDWHLNVNKYKFIGYSHWDKVGKQCFMHRRYIKIFKQNCNVKCSWHFHRWVKICKINIYKFYFLPKSVPSKLIEEEIITFHQST